MDAIELLELVKQIYYNSQRNKHAPQAHHKEVHELCVKQQDNSMTNSDYLKLFKSTANIIKFVGVTVDWDNKLIQEDITKLCANYHNIIDVSNNIIYIGIFKAYKKRYIPVAYLMGSDHHSYGAI